MSQIEISEERKQFLLGNFVEYIFEEDENGDEIEPNKSLFDSITLPEEIYFLAENLNWDDGALIPRWIIESPYCTNAAALIVFWTSAPDFYMEYSFGEPILEDEDLFCL